MTERYRWADRWGLMPPSYYNRPGDEGFVEYVPMVDHKGRPMTWPALTEKGRQHYVECFGPHPRGSWLDPREYPRNLQTWCQYLGLKRVTLVGAESTGKTYLGTELASHYESILALEYGREYTQRNNPSVWTHEDMLKIAMGHIKRTALAAEHARQVLIEDTDPLITAVWSDTLVGARDAWFEVFKDYADLYLLCDTDMPWVKDAIRYHGDPEERQRFQDACETELVRRGVSFVRIQGDPEQRLTTAVQAIDQLLGLTP